jgi:hypothetical protein
LLSYSLALSSCPSCPSCPANRYRSTIHHHTASIHVARPTSSNRGVVVDLRLPPPSSWTLSVQQQYTNRNKSPAWRPHQTLHAAHAARTYPVEGRIPYIQQLSYSKHRSAVGFNQSRDSSKIGSSQQAKLVVLELHICTCSSPCPSISHTIFKAKNRGRYRN